MRIAVIGAGIIGVTTAYELSADGHEVTVFERRQAVASDASFANAGVVSPGYLGPWAAPGMPVKVLAGLAAPHTAVRFGAGALAAPGWLTRYLWACRRRPHLANRRRMQRLGLYSRQRLDLLSTRMGLQYDQTAGYTVLYRHARDLARARRGLPVLDEVGVRYELLEADEARQREPALSTHTPLAGALHLPDDLVGNCRQFAHALKSAAQAREVRFLFGADVLRLSRSQPGSLYWREAERPQAEPRLEAFEACVVCAGTPSAALLAKLGVRVPLLSVHGYSLTAPVRHREGEDDPGPRTGVMDERFKVSITRLGQRMRVAGIAEVGGADQLLREGPLRTLYKVLDDWYPGAADFTKVQHWKGARPMLPDGPPLIGPSGSPAVWLNLGHGSSGWALSCGSARVLADLIGGRAPEIDIEGLSIDRLR